MSKILMPINPKYVDEIIFGNKKYEYRKIKPKRNDIDKMIIYCTFPIMKVVAEVDIQDIFIDAPEKIWELTKDYSGTSKKFYDMYYKKSKNAVAYKLGDVKVYDKPMKLSDIGIDYVPQSFVYLD